MPGHSRRSGAFSPPLSSATSHTHGPHSKLHIVSRLAIEGKAKQDTDGASIRLYLKISLPLESISPGMTVPLFAEENVRVHTSQVHPIDGNSAPYNFSSTASPILHQAARSLCLPSRSTKSYLSLFGISGIPSPSSRVNGANGNTILPLEEKYTGYILVSGYNVSYVLPKEFPPKYRIGISSTDSEDEGLVKKVTSRTPNKSRRSSAGEKAVIQFMAGIDLWVPYISKPPKAPYLLSIPIPRCLSNTIAFKIFPPQSTSASFASLSSEEDSTGWDLTTDPHVTRTASKHVGRSNLYNDFADDETSDSPVVGFSDGCGIQGTFTSSECIQIRWASPANTRDIPNHGDGRRRVGVADVRGDMTCTVLGRNSEGVKMRLNYQGTCRGVWFEGVATMLGMDLALDAHGCEVNWPDDQDGRWQVDGGTGFTGFDVGSPLQLPSRQPLFDLPQPAAHVTSTISHKPSVGDRFASLASRNSSTSSISSSSLLRAPLPQHSHIECSFETTPTPTTSELPSSVSSLTPSSSVYGSALASERKSRLPSAPITIHLNMNDLLPQAPSKNTFTFNISGTVVISLDMPNSSTVSQPDSDWNSESIPLPAFRVLTAETQVISTTVRSHSENGTVEVLASPNDRRNSTGRTTVLRDGSQMKCGTDGARIAFRLNTVELKVKAEEEAVILTPSRPQTPKDSWKAPLTQMVQRGRSSHAPIRYRDGPLIIPWVNTAVIPLMRSDPKEPLSYAVTVCLPAPVDGPLDWLEFGLAMPPRDTSSSDDGATLLDLGGFPPEVEIASASMYGVPVRFETFGRLQHDSSGPTSREFDEMGKKEWLSWVRVYTAGGRGDLEIVYIVSCQKEGRDGEWKAKGKSEAGNGVNVNIFLPLFSLPIGRMEVIFERLSDVDVSLQSNMEYRQNLVHGTRFFGFSIQPFSYLHLVITFQPLSRTSRPKNLPRFALRTSKFAATLTPTILAIFLLSYIASMRNELRQMKFSVDACSTALATGWDEAEPSTTATSTIRTPTLMADKWWLVETPTFSDFSVPTASNTYQPMHPQNAFEDEDEEVDSQLFVTETTPSPDDNASLFLTLYMPLVWPFDLRFEFARATDKALTGLEKIWNVMQLLFHWPLAPGG